MSGTAAPLFEKDRLQWNAFLDNQDQIAQELANHSHPICKLIGALWGRVDTQRTVMQWLGRGDYFQRAPHLRTEIAFVLAQKRDLEAQGIVGSALC
jgi:hypothetical protein